MKQIPLTQGKFATVDDEDYELLSKTKWYAVKHNSGKFYAASGFRIKYMHRVLECPLGGYVVDHINGDGLDNRRENLRVCKNSENVRNGRKMNRETTSKYKGVSFDSRSGRWAAQIRFNSVDYKLGLFESEVDAAKEFDTAARKYHGEFARLNFPE